MSGKEDEKIKKITALLEKGGTMTASHHECGAPLFRYQGKTVCPVCDIPEEEVKTRQAEQVSPPKPPAGKEATREGDETISRIIKNKLNAVVTGLEAETDLARIKERMECIEIGIKILKLLKEKEG